MRTTNKILISAFGIVLLFVIIALLYIRINLTLETVEGSGNVIIERREVAEFQRIDVRGNIRLHISQGDENSMSIEADDNLVELVIAKQDQDKLYLYLAKGIHKDATMNISLQIKQLTELNVSAGTRVFANDTIRGVSLKHVLQAGSESNLTLEYENMNLLVQAGGISNLSGSVSHASVSSLAGAIINAQKLEVENLEINGRAGSINTFHVTGTISGRARNGAIVNYTGEPDLKDFRSERGGLIQISVEGEEIFPNTFGLPEYE
ncbi:MAG: DUF2807 domain-containing protein [Bacteroidia bacterium]|nr:MAG: DUF2807 domain-containing protein [Bacteroidia bacterium]